jgi:hypothetical protein
MPEGVAAWLTAEGRFLCVSHSFPFVSCHTETEHTLIRPKKGLKPTLYRLFSVRSLRNPDLFINSQTCRSAFAVAERIKFHQEDFERVSCQISIADRHPITPSGRMHDPPGSNSGLSRLICPCSNADLGPGELTQHGRIKEVYLRAIYIRERSMPIHRRVSHRRVF